MKPQSFFQFYLELVWSNLNPFSYFIVYLLKTQDQPGAYKLLTFVSTDAIGKKGLY